MERAPLSMNLVGPLPLVTCLDTCSKETTTRTDLAHHTKLTMS